MKLSTLLTLCLFYLCPSFVFSQEVHTHAPGEKAGENVERFSVEKTIEQAKTVLSGEWWGNLSNTFDRSKCPLNPDALPEMYRILDDPQQQKYWDKMVSYIALLGGDEDVDKLEKLLERYKGKALSSGEETLFDSVVFAISAMDRHDIARARTVIDGMMSPDYWQRLDVKMANGRTGVTEFGPLAIKSKSNNADPAHKEKVQKMLAGIQDPAIKKLYAEYAGVAEKNYNKLMEAKRTGDWTVYYGKSASTPTPSLAVPRCHPDFAYEEFYTSTTLWTIPAKLDPTVEEELCKEALVAFNTTLEAVVKRDEKYLVTNTAVAGRPLLLKEEQTTENAEKIHAKMPELKKKWQNLVPLAQAFQKALSPAQHFVQLQSGFAINNATGGSLEAPPFVNLRKQPKLFYPFLLIRFRFDDLRDVAKKYPEIFNNKGRIPSVSENGEPYVVMIWENEQWYWNPFGM